MWSTERAAWRGAGEIDLVNEEPFTSMLRTVVSSGVKIGLLLDELGFIGVSGLRAIATAARQAPTVAVTLRGAPATLRRCWDLLDLDTSVPNVAFH